MSDETPGDAQTPSATTRMPRIGPPVASGSRVVIRVSRGPAPTAPSGYVSVPTLVGVEQGDALGGLQGLGLTAEVFNDTSASVPRGHVVGQLPHAGEAAGAGTEAVLIVSNGPAATPTAGVGLPIVAGLSETEAVSALRSAGLNPQVVNAFSPNVAPGTVIDQVPSPASLAEIPPKKSSLLWLWILIALLAVAVIGVIGYTWLNRTALVPSVVQMSQADAEAAITAAGFKVGSVGTTQTATAADVGKVIEQDPLPNTQARPGSAINIVVSGGQKLVSVPKVTGMTQANAESTLKGVGLTAEPSNGNSKTVPKGSVISQAPPAGQQVPTGTSVGITISQGPGNATVPNVVGQTQADAQNALKAAGLGSQVVSNYSTTPSGEVYEQTPAPGTLVAPGTVVSIHVSKGPAPAPTTVTVPSVIGKTQSAATSQLQGLGFKVSVSQIASGTAGMVVGQTPAADSEAVKGSTVSIVVSKGP